MRQLPVSLRFTRSGYMLVGVALVGGFAALNTNNNLLFLAWGLTLAAIVMSGVLSELNLRWVRVDLHPGVCGTPGKPQRLPLDIHVTRLPIYALQLRLRLHARDNVQDQYVAKVPYQFCLHPKTHGLIAMFTPPARGGYVAHTLEAECAYPFGFFVKTRRFRLRPTTVWCGPVPARAVLPVAAPAPSRQRTGEEFFALRPFRDGDDPRQIAPVPSARYGRWVCIERAAATQPQVVLHLRLPAGTAPARQEAAIAILCASAVQLLAQGWQVGLWAPGLALPQGSVTSAEVIRLACARLQAGESMPQRPSGHVVTLPA